MLRPWPVTISPEDLFIERYDQLLRWSLKLAGGDRHIAEDLVHDAFVHFTLVQPDLACIQNLDGYLYTTLRNRYLSHVRRAARTPFELSVVDYDSADLSLRASDPRSLMQVHEELRLICCYACARKETSKAGSVLILRFFHSYYPAEIAQMMKSTRQAVDIWIRMARSEARLYVENPQTFTILKDGTPHLAAQPNISGRAEDFSSELRRETFRHRHGDCLPINRLEAIYHGKDGAIDSRLLAHIVSCRRCLEAVTRLLGLAPPSDRHPTDTLGPMRGGGDQLKKSRLRAKEVLEHQATKLNVLVNGFFIGAQTISSEVSELTLSVNIDEKIGFVEVISEQEMLLLSMNVEAPPGGDVEQSSRVELSGERSLEARLSFLATWPSIEIVYRDRHFQEALATDALADDERPSARGSDLAKPLSNVGAASTRYATLLEHLSRPLALSFWLRPAAITAALAIILIGVLLVRTWTPPVSAAELLDRATTAEQATLGTPDTVVHRSLSLETRNVSQARLLSRKRIDLWQSAGAVKGFVKARRVYDESGKLEAGEWTRPDGSQTLYRGGRMQENQGSSQPLELGTDDIWRLDMSAGGFSLLMADAAGARVEDRADAYIIYTSQPEVNDPSLLRAELTLAKADLHAMEQTLVIQRDSEQIEYRFSESHIEHVRTNAIPPKAFEPGIDVVTSSTPSGVQMLGETSSPAADRSSTGQAASADLEVEVAYLLDRVNANTGEQVSLTRTPGGKLLVQGIVETDKRKTEIIEALRPVSTNPDVRIEVSTVAEAMKRLRQPSSKGTEQRLDVSESSAIPVYSELHGYFTRRGMAGNQIDDEIRRLSARILALSHAAVSHGWALRRLADQFKPEELQALGAEARLKRLAMIRGHATALGQQTERLRVELQGIFGESSGAGAQEGDAIGDESDLIRAIEGLVQRASANDRAIQSAFTISASGAKSEGVGSPQFFDSLRRVEKLAGRIKEFGK